ncbi:TRAP transporter small permease [Citreicella sp. C3M06]|uniref:TRAP transporter small permease n=1 Tax=Citreicella sp. C3M06 TaxID=2841564 RepID=UPI001C08D6E4|nr:TRAP transporter small permease [Citreicella sp. C3M06]MBU2959894.1 TRAP transporter small permease [Citreicella sp. C3M06]
MTRSPDLPPWLNRVAGPATLALTGLRRLVDLIAGLLFIYMALAIMAQILGRYVFGYSIAGTDETAVFAQVWLVLLGAGIAMRNRQHVGVDVLIRRTPERVQQLARLASYALGMWFLYVVFVGSFALLGIGMMVQSPALRLPMAIPYAALPVGMAYFMLEFSIASLPDILRPAQARANAAALT